jgi:hypothetical protein
MKYIALVLLVLATMAIACSNGPTPTPVVIVVTATPRPTVPMPSKEPNYSVPGDAGRHIRLLENLGWTREPEQDCTEDRTCMAIASPDECGYLLLYFNPTTGVEDGFSYGIDFESDWCPAGDVMAETQFDALVAIDAIDAGMWLGEMSETGQLPDGPGEVSGECGAWKCQFAMDAELFGVLSVIYHLGG